MTPKQNRSRHTETPPWPASEPACPRLTPLASHPSRATTGPWGRATWVPCGGSSCQCPSRGPGATGRRRGPVLRCCDLAICNPGPWPSVPSLPAGRPGRRILSPGARSGQRGRVVNFGAELSISGPGLGSSSSGSGSIQARPCPRLTPSAASRARHILRGPGASPPQLPMSREPGRTSGPPVAPLTPRRDVSYGRRDPSVKAGSTPTPGHAPGRPRSNQVPPSLEKPRPGFRLHQP